LGLDELISRLERDADARIAAIQARARADVDAIAAESERTSSREGDEALARRRSERRAQLDRELAEARQRARADVLRAQYALLDHVMARAGASLDAMESDDAYRAALPERLLDALRFVEGRGARVRCRPALAAAVRSAVAGHGDVTVEEVPSMTAGFCVVARDGSVEVDDTLPARLERLRPRVLVQLLTEIER